MGGNEMKILALGELIWDVFPDGAKIGGAPFNFAAHAAGLGAESYLLSAVGKDELGEKAVECAKGFKINDKFVLRNDKETGRCLVSLDENKMPKYNLLSDTAYDNLSVPEKIEDTNFDAFYFGTLIQRTENNHKVIKEILKRINAREIFCDVNIRAPHYNKESIELCLKSATILKISREELVEIQKEMGFSVSQNPKEAAREISSCYRGIKLIIITLDIEGAYCYETEKDKDYFCPAKKVEAVSTVGAGDSFGAAFLVEYLSGKTPDKALEKGANISAQVVKYTEAVPDIY
jgi:fructokinase